MLYQGLSVLQLYFEKKGSGSNLTSNTTPDIVLLCSDCVESWDHNKKTLTLLLLDQKKIARFFSNAQWDKEFPKVGGCLGIWYEIFGWYSLSSPRGISLGLWIPLFKYDYILLYNSGHITYKGSLSSHAKSAKNYIFDEQIPNPCKLNLKARPKSLYNLLLLHSILPIVQYRDSKALASERSSHIWGWQF